MRKLLAQGIEVGDLYDALRQVAGPTWYFDCMEPKFLAEISRDHTDVEFTAEQLADLADRLRRNADMHQDIEGYVKTHAKEIVHEAECDQWACST